MSDFSPGKEERPATAPVAFASTTPPSFTPAAGGAPNYNTVPIPTDDPTDAAVELLWRLATLASDPPMKQDAHSKDTRSLTPPVYL